ncbi:hypothetical protein WA158_003411 [Blastocystis sp. Blastoise]
MEIEQSKEKNDQYALESIQVESIDKKQLETHTWKLLESAVNCFFKNETFEGSYADILRSLYVLSYSGSLDSFYNQLKLENTWVSFYKTILKIREIIIHFDHLYCINVLHTSFITLCLSFWTDVFNNFPLLKNKIYICLLTLLKEDRDGKRVDINVYSKCIDMLIKMDIYSREFEPKLLEDTGEYYIEESDRLVDAGDINIYISTFLKRIQQEEDHSRILFQNSSFESLISVVEDKFIKIPHDFVIKKGLPLLLQNNDFEKARVLYTYCEKLDLTNELKDTACRYIITRGAYELDHCTTTLSLIKALINLHSLYKLLYKECFQENSSMSISLSAALSEVINRDNKLVAEVISIYIHSLVSSLPLMSNNDVISFNKNAKKQELSDKINSPSFIEGINNILPVYKYLNNKDYFESFYKIYLAKRLVIGSYGHFLAERYIIQSINECVGGRNTVSLTHMLEDLDKSITIRKEFQYIYNPSIPINITVISKGMWPDYSEIECEIPREFSDFEDRFLQYHKSAHKDRNISFIHGDSFVYVDMTFKKNCYHLYCSMFQYNILKLFTTNKSCSYKDIETIVKMEDALLVPCLTSLVTKGILVTQDNNMTITKDSIFTFNSSFPPSESLINLDSIEIEKHKTTKVTEQSLFHSLQIQIDAGIVRIVKSKKVISYSLLCQELKNSLLFTPDPAKIKERVEMLINREYLSRDPNSPDLLCYQN